jgi:hypothetical protein
MAKVEERLPDNCKALSLTHTSAPSTMEKEKEEE